MEEVKLSLAKLALAYGAPDYPVLRLARSVNWLFSGKVGEPRL
jgi:hypothetical protein